MAVDHRRCHAVLVYAGLQLQKRQGIAVQDRQIINLLLLDRARHFGTGGVHDLSAAFDNYGFRLRANLQLDRRHGIGRRSVQFNVLNDALAEAFLGHLDRINAVVDAEELVTARGGGKRSVRVVGALVRQRYGRTLNRETLGVHDSAVNRAGGHLCPSGGSGEKQDQQAEHPEAFAKRQEETRGAGR